MTAEPLALINDHFQNHRRYNTPGQLWERIAESVVVPSSTGGTVFTDAICDTGAGLPPMIAHADLFMMLTPEELATAMPQCQNTSLAGTHEMDMRTPITPEQFELIARRWEEAAEGTGGDE